MNPTNGCDMDSMNRLESYLEKYDIYMKENGGEKMKKHI